MCLCMCLIVEGLEKSASLASCDMGADFATSTQNAPASRQQRGKLSSLGKLFKPWKWRKKKTSDKFQDLSKGRMSLNVCFCVLYLIFNGADKWSLTCSPQSTVCSTSWRTFLDLEQCCSQKSFKRKRVSGLFVSVSTDSFLKARK